VKGGIVAPGDWEETGAFEIGQHKGKAVAIFWPEQPDPKKKLCSGVVRKPSQNRAAWIRIKNVPQSWNPKR
jgi:hypothetical protein